MMEALRHGRPFTVTDGDQPKATAVLEEPKLFPIKVTTVPPATGQSTVELGFEPVRGQPVILVITGGS